MESAASLSWLDYTIVGIILISTLVSLFRGFIREALSLAFWVLAFWVAQLYFREIATQLDSLISAPSLRAPVAFVIIFLVVLMLGGLVTFLIAKVIDATGLSGTDRVIGMLFGATRGVLLVGALVLLAGFTSMPKDPWWREAKLIGHFEELATWMRELLPADFASRINLGAGNILTGPNDPSQLLPPDLSPATAPAPAPVQTPKPLP
jgi:membrane protein required for colicin V production